MATIANVPIACPDCHRIFRCPVEVESRPGTEQRGGVLADVNIAVSASASEFTEHVMADPEAHPTFVIKDESGDHAC